MTIVQNIKKLYADPKYTSLIDVGLFILLICSFHFLYLGWQAIGYWPIHDAIANLMQWASNLLYDQTCWCLQYIFGLDITTVTRTHFIFTPDHEGGFASVGVIAECASLKQWLHWLFLMLIFPGPWKHKAWYIPAGLVIIEWTNVLRVCGVLIMQIFWPGSFHLAHDYIFKVLFYFVIFLMWVIWVECFVHPKKKNKKTEITA